MSKPLPNLPAAAFHAPKHHLRIYQGDCLHLLAQIPESSVDLVFADPPYFLSNGGITCHAGKMVSVHKGDWDKSRGTDANHEFNRSWLAACQRVLKPNGSIWVSGTSHVIHSVGFAMQQLGFKLLNDISWVKPNPPPNLSCRYFTHATETLIWAAKDKKSRHTFNYKLMRHHAGGKQMKSVWTISPPEPWEKKFGKHPTQKPVALLERILLASSHEGDLVLDPFLGSGTTLLAAFRLHRRSLGCELSLDFLSLSVASVPIWYRSKFPSLPSSFPLISFPILWIDPIAPNLATQKCPPISNSSSRSAASISLAASIAKSSSLSSLRVWKTPGKNSVPPAAPIPTPSSSSKPKPRFILPNERDLIPAWICISRRRVSTATKAPPNALAWAPKLGARQIFIAPLANLLTYSPRHKAPPRLITSALLVTLPSN